MPPQAKDFLKSLILTHQHFHWSDSDIDIYLSTSYPLYYEFNLTSRAFSYSSEINNFTQ